MAIRPFNSLGYRFTDRFSLFSHNSSDLPGNLKFLSYFIYGILLHTSRKFQKKKILITFGLEI